MNTTTPSVLIRVDASLRIGSGHLIRCRNLARGLRSRGIDVLFICRCHYDSIHASLLDGEFSLLELPSFVSDSQIDRKLSGYENWLGCSEPHDASDFWDAITSAGFTRIKACVIDHYALGEGWENFVRKRLPNATFLVLDDLANRSHDSDWLIDASRPNSDAASEYRELLSGHTKLLTGAYYALLSHDYSLLAPITPARRRLRRILIFFGGIDDKNFTALALSALSHPDLQSIDVDVVLGLSSPHLETISQAACSMPNVRIHVGLPSLSALMIKADLSIGAAGITSWERACLGLPAVVIPVAKNQECGAYELHRIGAAISLEAKDATEIVGKIRSTLLALLASQTSLKEMSTSAIRLGDGRGVQRAVTCLLGPDFPLRLRSTVLSDIWLYYWWASDLSVRSQSFNTQPIAVADHQNWFKSCIDSPNFAMFILVDRCDLPLGQIRFERQPRSNVRVKISFSLDRIVRGLGLGVELLELGLDALCASWGDGLQCFAQVKADNLASARVFLKYGFEELPTTDHLMREFQLTIPKSF